MQPTSSLLRPFFNIEIPHWWYFYRKINWLWWLQRIPMFALAIPAAYGVGAFSSIDGKLPEIVAGIAGIAFESTYIGAIALGDQMTKNDKSGRRIWFSLNIAAVLASALFSTLYFSGGKYNQISAESITHGALLPVINFFYGYLLHHISSISNAQVMDDAESTKEHCEYCNLGKPTRHAIYAHYRYCPAKNASNVKHFTTDGKPLP